MEPNATDKAVPHEITALLSAERVILRETQRAVTPFGGIAVFISFLTKIGFVEAVRQHMPIRWRSPNHIDPTCTFTAFLVSVLAGARRFAHASLLRGDRALHALLGMDRFPTDDTIRNLFRKFGMGQVQRLFEPLAEWQMQRLPQRADGSMFVWGEQDYLRVFKLNMDDFRSGGQGFKSWAQSKMPVPRGMPGGMLSLSTNSDDARSGIVWASHPLAGDANNETVEGVLRAFDANDIATELWNSKQYPDDNLGMFAKFNPPVVANGKVYVATFADPVKNPDGHELPPPHNKLIVYGLLQNPRNPSGK